MKRLLVMLTGLLLSSVSVMAQSESKTTSVTPTALPGEEKLTARERAERDFLMPARHKQAAVLKAAREEAAVQTTTDVSALNAEPTPEPKAPEAAPKVSTAAPVARRTSSARRHHTSASKKKVVRKSSSSKRKTTSKSSRHRRR